MFSIGASAILAIIMIGTKAMSDTLSESALFHRCYTQITSLTAKENNSRLLDVRAGRKKAIDACMEVLQSAQFTGPENKTISNTGDLVAKAVLLNFHRLHSSWFYSKDFPVISWPGHTYDIKNLYDSSTPALYFTRSLFRPNAKASDALTTTDFLRAVRTTMSPATGPATGHTQADYVFSSLFSFAPFGEMLGVEPTGDNVVSFIATKNSAAGSLNLYRSLGGGFLGTNAYLLLNIGGNAIGDYKTDGALKMHRIWGKAVYRDVLCRELPVVRTSDVDSFVDSTSSAPFRTSANCTKCHASHDRLSATIRGMKVTYVGIGDPTGYGQKSRGGNFPAFHAVAQPAETAWPTQSDADYYRRPNTGVLFFRNYEGQLVDQPLSGLPDLGQKLASTTDYNICLAKRYYSYFTGIDVNTGDLEDPDNYPKLTSQDSNHRQIVITLGKNLKTHQSMIQLIREILSLPHYKRSDFGTGGGVVAQ